MPIASTDLVLFLPYVSAVLFHLVFVLYLLPQLRYQQAVGRRAWISTLGDRCCLLNRRYERKVFQEKEMLRAKSQTCKCAWYFKEEMVRVITEG